MKKKNILYMVIPCYNEEEVLPETTKRLEQKLGDLIKKKIISEKSKVMYVNDGSKDKPFKTINKAITEAFAKNIYVNIHLLEGTYSGTGNINLDLSKLLGYLNIIGVDGKTIINGDDKNYAFNFGNTLNVNLKIYTIKNMLV